jgi:hypothetical protein
MAFQYKGLSDMLVYIGAFAAGAKLRLIGALDPRA